PADDVALCSGRTVWSTEAIQVAGRSLGPVVMTDGPHGVRRTTSDEAIIAALPATCFPTASALASSWDTRLVEEVGAAIATEARSLGVAAVLGPGINIKRHPYGGRNFEYFSEDPLLGGALGAAMVRGIQRDGVAACVKHFAVNNQETQRMTVDAVVDPRALHEIYLAGFERALAARPRMVMCAYNRINGAYASDHRWLLTDVLRDRWGFDGIVVSDWGAVNDRVAALRAGLDLEMPGSGGAFDRSVLDALDRGRLLRRELDVVVERLRTFISTADAATRGADGLRSTDGVSVSDGVRGEMAEQHHELARRAAASSSVLLTNDGLLPLPATGTVAVVGEFADQPRIQGSGSSQVTPTQVDSLLDRLRLRFGDESVRYAAGYDLAGSEDRDDLLDEAALVARSADVAIVIVGLPPTAESEGFDRTHLRLPEQHNRLVRAVCDANPNTVVVLVNGAPVQVGWVDQPRAILESSLGGQGAGDGIARVLLGDVDPGGRLAETMPLRAADHGSDAWFPGSGRRVQYRESIHVGYRWFDTVEAPVLFPFGHGLSYTRVDYGELIVGGCLDADDGVAISVTVQVENVGDRRGTEVVQLYARRPHSRIERSAQELVGFARCELDPGERTTVSIDLDERAVRHWDVATGGWRVEPGPVEFVAAHSSRDARSTAVVTLTGSWSPSSADGRAPRSAADLADDDRFARLLGRPIPDAEPVEPFHRNSTLAEVADTGFGKGLLAGATRAARRQLDTGDGLDPVTERLVERMMADAPLRAMVLLGGGRIGFAALDRMIAVMNAGRRRTGRRANATPSD
ncbi:MAG: glycoside hydrolase family 3 C-terminal domain-containing protein, partial [Actinomycetota bacterium]